MHGAEKTAMGNGYRTDEFQKDQRQVVSMYANLFSRENGVKKIFPKQ